MSLCLGPRCAFTPARSRRCARGAPLVAGPGARRLVNGLRPSGAAFSRVACSQRPGTQSKGCTWPGRGRGQCGRRRGEAGGRLARAELGAGSTPATAGRGQGGRRGTAPSPKLRENFEARGSEAGRSAFARRSSCPSVARLSPGRTAFRPRPRGERRWRFPGKPDRLGRAGLPPCPLAVRGSWAAGETGRALQGLRAHSAPAEAGGGSRPGSGSALARLRRYLHERCARRCTAGLLEALSGPDRSGARGRGPGDPAVSGRGPLVPNFVPCAVHSSSGIFTHLDSPPPGSPLGVRSCSLGGSHRALTHRRAGTRGPRKESPSGPFALGVGAQF